MLGRADRGDAGLLLPARFFLLGIALVAGLDDLAVFCGAGLAFGARHLFLHLLHQRQPRVHGGIAALGEIDIERTCQSKYLLEWWGTTSK